MAKKDRGLELVATIQELRRAVVQAVDAAADRAMKFKLEETELELQVLLSRETTGSGKVSVYVLDAGADVTTKREQVQTVRLWLTPLAKATGGEKKNDKNPPKKPAPTGDVLVSDVRERNRTQRRRSARD
ncbi:MAG: hypothetical protein JW751_15395 [Polyangiaceae bacterium]|nr:hypothetical protein [Polyangiaceae bacterium]